MSTSVTYRPASSTSTRELQGGKTTCNDAPKARDWSDLPSDLLELIIRPLNFVDRYHLALACKRWLSVARATPRANGCLAFGSPFLLLVERGGRAFSLLDPYHNDKYTLPTPNLNSPVKILFCKDGWLLMSAKDGQSIFFFNPLTKATINLPKFNRAQLSTFSFSHAPTSPHCVVMAINANFDYLCDIFVCRRGATNWDERQEYYCDYEFNLCNTTPIFHKGSFYCLGDYGRLGVFDPTARTWTVMEEPAVEEVGSLTHRLYIIEFDGELIWVRTNMMGDSVHICKLDPSSSEWKEVDSLGDRCLFVSRVASVCPPLMAAGSTINAVYFGMTQDDDFVFYSCKARRLRPRRDFDGAKDYLYTSCWIEPVFVQPSAEELQWS